MAEDQLLEAWRTNHRINVFLIEHISEEGMRSTLSKRGGRDVARQFAHLHNVRLYQLEGRAKDLAEGLTKFESKYSPSKQELLDAMELSTERVGRFLVDVLGRVPKRRGMRKGIFTHLSYFIAHESHHRGSILLTLKQCGHRMDNDKAYGIWAWDQI